MYKLSCIITGFWLANLMTAAHAGGVYSFKQYGDTPVPQTYTQQPVQSRLPATVPADSQPSGANPQRPTVVFVSEPKPAATELVNSDQTQDGDDWMKVGRLNKKYHEDVSTLIQNQHQSNEWMPMPLTQAAMTVQSVPLSVPRPPFANTIYDPLITSLATKHNVSGGLIKAVMHTESAFNRYARSPVGAQGLMQLMPATARRFKVSDPYDPVQNIQGGVQYLGWLINRFNGNLSLAVAAYNAGEGNVDKYRGIPPFRETQDYVKRVLTRYNALYKNF